MIRTLIDQVSAASGTTALTVAIVVPLTCLLFTPGDAHAVYRSVFESYGSSLPPMAETCDGFPKAMFFVGWLAVVAFQAWAFFRARPQWWWWLRPIQVAMAAGIVPLYMWWHFGTMSMPMLKFLSDLTP